MQQSLSLNDLVKENSVRKQAIQIVEQICPDNPTIVEIGASREFNQKAYQMDGLITLHLLDMMTRKNGVLLSVDIDPITIYNLTGLFSGHNASAHCQDGVDFLIEFEEKIDVLVLDSMDVWLPGYKEHHLSLYQAARGNLSEHAVLVLDDIFPMDNLGKGELVLPVAIEDGFKYIVQGYTTIMQRR